MSHARLSLSPAVLAIWHSASAICADFRGGAICLFRTHFLGWSGRFFHGCDGSFPRTRAPVPATESGEPLGTDAEPGPSLSDGVRGPSHRFPECGMGNSECGMRKKYEWN